MISLILPFSIAFKPPYSLTSSYETALQGIDSIFFIDILLSFRSATFDIMTGEEVTEPHEIARKYLFSSRFLLDVLSCLPWDQFSTSDVFDLLGLFKIVRVARVGAILLKLNVKSSTKIVSAINA